MARVSSRRRTADEKAELAESIARAEQRLRQLKTQQRHEDHLDHEAHLLAAGKVVEACGLLDLEAGELEAVLKRGMAALPAVAGYLASTSPGTAQLPAKSQ